LVKIKNNNKKVAGWYLPITEKHFEKFLIASSKPNKDGEYQKEQRLKSFTHLEHFNTAIDIGACVGFWTKDLCKKFSNVICFEPSPSNAECLELNLKDYTNYKLYKVALSNVTGTKKLLISEKGIGSNSLSDPNMDQEKFINVPTKKIDEYNFRNLSYIKMDVQFHELEVLEGATKTLKKNSPVLCIECARRNNDELTYVKKIVSLLQKLDFKIVGGFGKELFFKKY
tara:strand:+ start:235 stop:915 length:681 start_codon:yes stop_codon:yes gene_type:complete